MQNKLQKFRAGAQALTKAQDAQKLLAHNEKTIVYGLELTKEQAILLLDAQAEEQRYHGRLEFGEGPVGKLIDAFADSPYITRGNYVKTLQELTETFYYYKNETGHALTDDELIEYMRKFFNGSCEGSIELLNSRELDSLARSLR